MRNYVHVYGGSNQLFTDFFQGLVQNRPNINNLIKEHKEYDVVGAVFISQDYESYKALKKEGLDEIYDLNSFTYNAKKTGEARIIANQHLIGDVEYETVLEGVTEEIEHLRLYAKGVPMEEHHDTITPEYRKKKVKTLPEFELKESDKKNLLKPSEQKITLHEWKITYQD